MRKKILLLVLILSCVASFAKCKKKKKPVSTSTEVQKIVVLNNNQIWMRYDDTKCSNPWSFNWLVKPTDEQLAGAVKSDLTGKQIIIQQIRTWREDVVSCEACTCPTGLHYYVLVSKGNATKLKTMKFYEVEDVPDSLKK